MLVGSRHGPEPYDWSMRPPSRPKAAYSEIGDKARHNVRYGGPNRKCLRRRACPFYPRQQTSVRRPLECAPGAGQVEVSDLTGVLGFRKMKAMARQQRSHSIEFKRQVVQEYIAGETLYGLAKRHDLSRQLIRVWVEKYEAGGLDADAQAADLLHEYETKIVALERMVGRQALEIEFLKGALKNAPRPRSATTSVIAGPTASPSQKDAG